MCDWWGKAAFLVFLTGLKTRTLQYPCSKVINKVVGKSVLQLCDMFVSKRNMSAFLALSKWFLTGFYCAWISSFVRFSGPSCCCPAVSTLQDFGLIDLWQIFRSLFCRKLYLSVMSPLLIHFYVVFRHCLNTLQLGCSCLWNFLTSPLRCDCPLND